MTTASTAKAVPFTFNRFLHTLCALFLIAFVLSAIHPVMLADWALENILVVLFVGLLAATYGKFQFSELSYLMICLYLCLHEWGAHHMYANVPIGEWMRAVFHTVRNDYDRVCHFAFGLLLAYPGRELLMRQARLGGAWALWLPVLAALGFGAAYEILEAIAANLSSPQVADAFLGLQGDPWDTHKDMFMGFAGALVAMSTVAVVESRQRARRAREESLVEVGR